MVYNIDSRGVILHKDIQGKELDQALGALVEQSRRK
jgi:hypothetical protein